MNKFFNIIPAADGCCILLYGEISDYHGISSAQITKELLEAQAKYDKIDIRINSNGGEVYAGIAIFNALRSSTADITIYVDGIAASMASVIALCGKPVQMSQYARLMLHSVSGGVWGNTTEMQKQIELMQSLEDTLCEMYASRLGKSIEDIKATYFDGEDHWLKASEALELGLIDGIYDAEPIEDDSTPEAIYRAFNNRLQEPQKQKEMNLDEIKKRPRFAACASEADVFKVVDALEAENNTLQAENSIYRTAETQREAAEVTALLDAAEADGRINATTRSNYEALLNADRTNGEAALVALPKKKSAMQDIADGGGTPELKGAWERRQEEIANKLKQ